MTFPAGLLFVCLQCVLTYRVAVTALDYWMAHVRVALAAGALVSLVLSILPDSLGLVKGRVEWLGLDEGKGWGLGIRLVLLLVVMGSTS